MKFLPIVLSLVLLQGSAFSQKYSTPEREILKLQDQRSTGEGKLFSYLNSQDANLRYRALIALANIQDSATVGDIVPLLDDGSAKVRAAAAFALGQIGSKESQKPLAERLAKEKSKDALKRIIEALGKCGTDSALSILDSFKISPKLAELNGEIALSVARCALRGVKSQVGVSLCLRLLSDPSPEVRWKALYALWRMSPYEPLDKELEEHSNDLKKLSQEKNGEVRMHLATLLGRAKTSVSYTTLRDLARREKSTKEWRVQVQIVRSLINLIPEHSSALDEVLPWLDSQETHVTMALLGALGGIQKEHIDKAKNKDQLRQKLLALLSKTKRQSDLVKGEAIVVIGKLFPADFAFSDLLQEKKTSIRLRTKVLEGMSLIPSVEHLSIILSHVEDEEVKVAVGAWEALRKLLTPANIRKMRKEASLAFLPDLLYRRMKSSLLRDDMAVTTLVSQAAGDSSIYAILIEGGRGEQIVEELMLTSTRLSSPNDTEAMQALLETLGKIGDRKVVPVLERALLDPDKTVAVVAAASLAKITGEDYSASIPKSTEPLYTDYDWRGLERITPNQRVRMKTNRGTITLQLMKDHAPFSILSFVKLVRRGFYKGLTFHRVVPNFVIQGGDPRGDGWGGPGYSIRSEWSLVNYERGSVGLASAGKDTEGCQFFITHSPQPHLDGRYTIFGRVVQGMDVVDRIQIGDRIESVELLK
ncbi:MAG TPA: peptidylprolyl isomerase [Bacteroidota bacterium]|nr:peptidylprolyl isomerase [Bacteroidota bacterium]